MKNLIALIAGFLVFCCFAVTLPATAEENPDNRKDKVNLYYSPDMEDLALQWAAEYQRANDGIIIRTEVIPAGKNQMPELGESDIALITGQDPGRLTGDYYRKAVIGRDVVVPIVNPDNPLSGLIRNFGLSPQQLVDLFAGKGARNWGILDDSGINYKVNGYLSDDEKVRNIVAGFLSLPPDELAVAGVTDAPSLVQKIRSDKYGLGWCKLTDVTDPETGELVGGISLLPIDRNGNGQIDHFENIYTGINDFNRGVWIGKYPRKLITNIYSLMPDAGLETAGSGFVTWLITDGQETLATLGYSTILSIEKAGVMDDMARSENLAKAPGSGMAATTVVLLILGGLVILILIIAIIFGRSGSNAQTSTVPQEDHGGFINGDSLALPGGVYFDKTHTWAFMEKEGSLRIGIDDFLQHVTGTFTRVIMKSPGEKIKKNEHLVSLIREGKQIDLYSPVSGTIVGINPSIHESPSLINTSPYNDGWLYMLEPTNWLRETGFLHMAEKHMAWLKSEFERLKDFLAIRLQSGETANQGFVLQEGGMLRDHVLEDLDPEIWEDFQKCFIDAPL